MEIDNYEVLPFIVRDKDGALEEYDEVLAMEVEDEYRQKLMNAGLNYHYIKVEEDVKDILSGKFSVDELVEVWKETFRDLESLSSLYADYREEVRSDEV